MNDDEEKFPHGFHRWGDDEIETPTCDEVEPVFAGEDKPP